MRNNISKSFKRSVTAAAVAMSLGVAIPAMANDGVITGTSVNQSGNVLANVTITIKNLTTGLTRSVQSDSQGNYRFPLLPSGNYSLEAKKRWFYCFTTKIIKSWRSWFYYG
ncbi:MAG: carboxypeptidase-like regulatory domain-containing protein [Thalassotalea sp.]|nr:carboxypeptidase-like regulatory domain-containing protein [Thalassotalea sp.]